MTREELTKSFLEDTHRNFILELATGFGKTFLALSKIDKWKQEVPDNKDFKILIVIPRLVLKDNWITEINKFHFNSLLPNITFVTYVSLPKYAGNQYDIIVADEGHHTSERCMNALNHIKSTHMLVLSATLKKEHKFFFTTKYKAHIIKVNTKEAIDSNVLPDPKVILIPLTLDNVNFNCIIEKNIKKNTPKNTIKTIGYSEKWKYRSYKGPLNIVCTPQQYYTDTSNLIEWYKQKGMHNAIMKNIWLHKAGERLKWLAKQKADLIRSLLKELKNYRILTFCPSIEQSESLGCPCVNSKVGTENLDKFNNKKIKHIASVAMLDEGISPIDCKIGLFQMINSSLRLLTQREGRILRHKEPVLIFPYWKYTREQEIIDEFIKDYNPKLITTLDTYSINNIKKYI